MSDDLPLSHPLRTAGLSQRKPTRFTLQPDQAARTVLAGALGLIDLPALRFSGELRPAGRQDFVLEAALEADVVQACIVTLAPVPARISEKVIRRYLADWSEPEAEESEMPEDDSSEPLPEVIDLGLVLTEALSLSLPPYPRAGDAAFDGFEAAPEGAEPLGDEVRKPFAGLGALLRGRDEGQG